MEERVRKARLSLRLPLVVGGIGFALCALAFMALGIYVYWDSPKIIGFLAAWIPFAFSILIAFFPSTKEMKHPWLQWTWRATVVVLGFGGSAMFWHQEELSDRENAAQTQSAVNKAVSQANEHSDKKFNEMQGKVTDLGNSLTKSFSDQMGKTETDLTSSIGKVGKPDPPERPRFTFSLWEENVKTFPLESEVLSPDVDGSYHISFAVRNDSAVQAQGIEEWVHICDLCAFAVDPPGFDRPKGMDERERHRSIPGMNGGVTLVEGNEIRVKAPNLSRFSMIFKVTCGTCGEVEATKEYWIVQKPTLIQQ